MLRWLLPRPPLEPVEKAWTETHMLWLAEQFGLPRLLEAEVIPVQRMVQPDYAGTADDARAMLSCLCESFAVAPEQVDLEIAGDACGGGAAVEQAGRAIHIGGDLLANPYALAATLARELAFQQLPLDRTAGTLCGPAFWLADLAAICLGYGVIVAHTLSDTSPQDHSCGCTRTQSTRPLPARMAGYALALFAHVRDERHPQWKNSLRLDALAVYDRALRYLRRTSDTLFTVENASRPVGPRATSDLLQQLKSGSRSARVAALWELRDARHAPAAVESVAWCLHDRLPALREEAARTLAVYGSAAQCVLPSLIDLLEDGSYSIRAAAARALGAVGATAEETLVHLLPLLRDPDRDVILAAAATTSQFGEHGEEALPVVLEALRSAVVRCDHQLIDVLTHTLYSLDPDPTDRVMEFFQDDPELREQLVHIIVDSLNERDSA